jgi:hypothetical protein
MSMENIEAKFDAKAGKLYLMIDTKQRLGASKSDKNIIVATTRGISSYGLPDGKVLKMNINLFTDK